MGAKAAFDAAGGVEGISETLSNAAEAAKEKIAAASDAIGATAKLNQAKDAIVDGINKIPGGKATMDGAKVVMDAASGAAHAVKSAADLAIEKAGGVEGIKEKLDAAGNVILDKATDFAGAASEKLHQMRDEKQHGAGADKDQTSTDKQRQDRAKKDPKTAKTEL